MSGYDERTGWVDFTPKKWGRYFRLLANDITGPIEQVILDRLQRAGLADSHFATWGGLHVRCGPNRLWTLLSGRPASEQDPPQPSEVHACPFCRGRTS